MTDRSYGGAATTWRAYQPHLPPEVRLAEDDLPAESWWAWDGLDVHLDRWSADAPRATVVVLHGAGGYGRLLAPFGRLLRDAGCDVVLPDLPGYGLTDCPTPAMRYERWVACAAALVQDVALDGRPVGVFGLSMGGMQGQHAAGSAPATLMDPRSRAVRRGAGRIPTPAPMLCVEALDDLRVPMPLLAPLERMSSSTSINRLCLRDPQGGSRRVPFGFLRSWMTYEPTVEPERFDRCPVLLTHPMADRWTPPSWSLDVLGRIPAPTRFVELAACEHLPIEEPGLSALRRALVAWVDDLT
jgi:alpha-beta hydrolase superfamily lysophospholipase